MNNSSDGVSMRYLKAINRYIAGIEKGNLEAVAAVLHEAEDDAELEQILLEISTVYQADDHTTPEYREIAAAQSILQATVRSHFAAAEVHSTSESQQTIMSELTATKTTSTISSLRLNVLLNALTRSSKQDFSLNGSVQDSPTHPKRMGTFIQTSVAVLVVVVLVASFITLFASRHPQSGSPLIQAHEDHVAAAITGDGTISAFNANTGAVLWTYKTLQGIINDETGLVIKDHILYALANGHVYALHLKDGSLLWQYHILIIPPTYLAFGKRFALDQGIVYVSETGSDPHEKAGPITTFYGKLYAIRARDGKLLWQYNSTTYPFLDANNGAAHVMQQYGKGDTVTIQALRGTDRKVLWSTSHLNNVVAIGADNTLYTATISQQTNRATLQAIKSNGSILWSQPLISSIPGNAHISNNMLIYGSGSQFCSYQLASGEQKWCSSTGNSTQEPSFYPSSTLTNNILYSIAPISNGSSNTHITAYQASNGMIIWTKQYPGLSLPSDEPIQPVIANGVMVTNLGGSIYALNSTNGHELWHADISQVDCVTVGE